MKQLHVALLAGGKSGEREVSLSGAKLVEEYLDKGKYRITRYDPATDLDRIVRDAADIDVALLVLHGAYGEDGTVQGFLDLLDIPYQGAGVLGSALAMDKNLSKELYRQHGLPTAPSQVVESSDVELDQLVADLGLPLVVKPVRVGSSLGMTIVKHKEQVKEAIDKALAHDSEALLESFLAGREITVGVLGNDEISALPLIEIIPGKEFEFFDYEAKYVPGASEEICPANVPAETVAKASAYAVQAHRVLKLKNYSRTDMILTADGELYLLETNTIPGMTINSLLPKAAREFGLEYPELLDTLITLALEQ